MLLIDVGNSRLKWRQSHQAGGQSEGLMAHQGSPENALLALEVDEPDSIWISSVAGLAKEMAMSKSCLARWQRTPTFARTGAQFRDLINGYTESARLGVDRWLAMIACYEQVKDLCVVADAGTALTIDVIAEDGRHQGGVIAAGLSTSASAVLGATRFPVRDSQPRTHHLLGLDTEACVRQGALLSCLGALELISSRHPGARCFIGGGDAAKLLEGLGANWEHRPNMVLDGLQMMAGDESPIPSASD